MTAKAGKKKAKRTRRPVGLIEGLIRKGKTTSEIMEELKIKSKATLQKAYIDELVAAGKVKPLPSARAAKGARALRDTAKVGKRGTLVVPTEMIEHFGFKTGDTFKISKRGDRIILGKQ